MTQPASNDPPPPIPPATPSLPPEPAATPPAAIPEAHIPNRPFPAAATTISPDDIFHRPIEPLPKSENAPPTKAIPAAPSIPPAVTKSAGRYLISAALLLALALLILTAALWDYQLYISYDFDHPLFYIGHDLLRPPCLAAWIICGIAGALSFGGVILSLERFAAAVPLRWFPRLTIALFNRVLLLAQLATAALAIGCIGLIIFKEPIPAPDVSTLDPQWTPPPDEPDDTPILPLIRERLF